MRLTSLTKGMPNKNIILITVECVRNDIANSIQFLNNSDHEIRRYENAFSVGCWTIPSILSLLTSTYPLMHDGKLRVSLPRVSLAEILLKEGYNTIAINNHPYLTRDKFGNGFKSYNHLMIKPGETGTISKLKNKLEDSD